MKRYCVSIVTVFLNFFCLLFAGAATADDSVGALAGGLSVTPSGGASYSVPISLPPGINGVQPDVGLSYSSQAGSGLLGVGWNLSASGAISRCPTTLEQDGFIDGVDFDNNDRFCFNGARLVLVSGVYGGAESVYKTEVDSKVKVIARSSSGVGPAFFDVYYPNGLIETYGYTNDSKIFQNNSYNIAAWHLSFEQDRSGNRVTYTYTQDAVAKTHLLSRIAYNGYSVEFVYELRGDTSSGYIAPNTLLAEQHRLTQVLVKAGTVLSFSYKVAYQTTLPSTVAKISHCSSSNVCVSSNFTFSNESVPPLHSYDNSWAESLFAGPEGKSKGTQHADLNGDGLEDLIQLYYFDATAIKKVSLNTGNSFSDSTGSFNAASLPDLFFNHTKDGADAGTRLLDINGDGLPDLIRLRQKTRDPIYGEVPISGNQKEVFLNTGSGFSYSNSYSASLLPIEVYFINTDNQDLGTRMVDINGDHLPDIVQMHHIGGADKFSVHLNTGTGFSYSGAFTSGVMSTNTFFNGAGVPDMGMRFSDINGDGLNDIIILYHPLNGNYSNTQQFRVHLNNGSGGFDYSVSYSDSLKYSVHAFFSSSAGTDMGTRLADINADGLVDLIQMYKPLNGDYDNKIQLKIAINTGSIFDLNNSYNNGRIPTTFFSGSTTDAMGTHDMGTRLADMNGDGLVDLVQLYLDANSAQRRVHFNTGKQFEEAISIFYAEDYYVVDSAHNSLGTEIFDVNGDGAEDLVQSFQPPSGYYGGTAQRRVLLSKKKNVMLSEVVDSFGGRQKVTFGLGINRALYSLGSASVYPVLRSTNPGYLVSTLFTDNGKRAFNQTTYQYEGLKTHIRGLGSLGFRKVITKDVTTGITSETTYSQDWQKRTTGLAESQVTKTASNAVLSQQTAQLTNRYQGVHTQIFLPVVTLTTGKKWDLNGSFIGTTSSESIFDSNGQVTQSTSCATENAFTQALVSCTAMGIATRKETTTFSYHAAEQVPHLPGLLSQKQTTASVPSTHTYQPLLPANIVRFDYYLDRGLLKSETVQPGTSLAVTKSYTYDAKGMMLTTTLSGADITSATTTRTVDAFGRLLTEKNPLNHTTSYQYSDSRFPHLVTQVTSANGIVTRFNYDSFARKQNEVRADGTVLTFNRYWCVNVSTCVTGELFKLAAFETNKPDVYSFYDYVGREVRKSTLGFNGVATGAWIDQTQEYDSRGLLVKSSDPYYRGELINYTLATYDLLGRPLTSTSADGSVNTLQYQGRTTRTTNALGQTKTVTKNIVGQDIEVLDTQNNALTYGYDTLGNLSWMRDPAGNYTYLVYNERGFKVRMLDPNQGDWRYTYFVDGQLKSQLDAKGQITQFTYDILGRMKTRVESTGTTTWTYDVGTKALGKLSSVVLGNTSESYTYDSLGRLDITSTSLEGQSFAQDVDYDSTGRMLSLKYPNNYKVRYQYNNALGIVSNITDDLGTTSFYKPTYMDAKGATEAFTLGGKINVTHDINDVTGLTNSINARVGTTTIQNLTYQWDRIGNLTYQWDTTNNLNQDYQYDSLNRLTYHRSVQGTTTTTQTLQYNALGNITYKSDVGNYTYGASCTVGGVSIKAGIHAVTAITGSQPATYCYDQNGNQVSGAGRTITYSPFNKPLVVTKGSTTAQFFYDFNRALYKKVESGETTFMLGSYERVTSSTSTVHKIYIGSHTLITQNGTTFTPSYLLRDHLGSLVAVADKNGVVQEKLSYDAWGKRRNINGTAISLSVLNAFKPKFSQKGFTNHKHVDSVGLIHMNGRVYDPITARFLSADPIIQSPSNLQSLNRYSYVMNNPLSFVDPSGYFSLSQELENAVEGVQDGLQSALGAIMVFGGLVIAIAGTGAAAAVPIVGPVLAPLVTSIGLAIVQMGENEINNRPRTENVIIEASVSLPFDHGSFDNSKPVKVTQPVHTAEMNNTASPGTIGSPGVTGSGSGMDPDILLYGIACANADLCGININASRPPYPEQELWGVFDKASKALLSVSPWVSMFSIALSLSGDSANIREEDRYKEGEPRFMYHYSPDQVLRGGYLWKNSYLTPDATLTSDIIVQRLALQKNKIGMQFYKHTFEVYPGEYTGATNSLSGTRLVAPAHGQIGYGVEYISTIDLYPIGPSVPAN